MSYKIFEQLCLPYLLQVNRQAGENFMANNPDSNREQNSKNKN
jgi:hypothetical protein